MTVTDTSRKKIIGRLNDRVRHGLDRNARTVFTGSCLATLAGTTLATVIVTQARVLAAIRQHSFTNDTYGERDFGQFEFDGDQLLFKIDYFDLSLDYGSEDPSDASQTTRVMTIMLASDY